MIRWDVLREGDVELRLKTIDTSSKIGDDEHHVVLMHGIDESDRVNMRNIVTLPFWVIKAIHDWYEIWVQQ